MPGSAALPISPTVAHADWSAHAATATSRGRSHGRGACAAHRRHTHAADTPRNTPPTGGVAAEATKDAAEDARRRAERAARSIHRVSGAKGGAETRGGGSSAGEPPSPDDDRPGGRLRPLAHGCGDSGSGAGGSGPGANAPLRRRDGAPLPSPPPAPPPRSSAAPTDHSSVLHPATACVRQAKGQDARRGSQSHCTMRCGRERRRRGQRAAARR